MRNEYNVSQQIVTNTKVALPLIPINISFLHYLPFRLYQPNINVYKIAKKPLSLSQYKFFFTQIYGDFSRHEESNYLNETIECEDNHLWHVIAKADSAHRDEDEVEALEETPILPHVVQCGPYEDVSQKNDNRHRDR